MNSRPIALQPFELAAAPPQPQLFHKFSILLRGEGGSPSSVPKPLKVPSLARSVPKPLKDPSLARSVPKPLRVRSVPKPLKVPSFTRSVPKPLKVPSLAREK